MPDGQDSCVFEYMYRDAANWKTTGQVLLRGSCYQVDIDALVSALDGGQYFVAEQVGVPPLQKAHLDFYGPIDGEDLDHAFHEFIALRPAEPQELAELPIDGELSTVVARIRASANLWDCTLSPFGRR